MNPVAEQCNERMKKSIIALKDEFAALRTGRASPSLLDKIKVECYGQKNLISQIATVSAPEARLLVIQPWDRALISEIEKAIQKSELSLNPSSDGKVIRIAIPPLTEERRKELVKHAKSQAEQSRVAIRNIRRDCLEELKKQSTKEHSAMDATKKDEEDIQHLTDSFIVQVAKVLEEKEKEILEI